MLGAAVPTDLERRRTCFSTVTAICQTTRSPHACVSSCTAWCLGPVTAADVVGGQCVSHGYCAAKFACVGCAGKVPDPAKRHQIEKHKQWASLQVEYAAREGLHPEAERMKQLMRDCDNELAEMDLIDSYRRDELHEVLVQIEF